VSVPRLSIECPGGGAHRAAIEWRAQACAACPACGAELELHPEEQADGGGLAGCLACAHPELYTRKDFPPALGIGIVAAAAALVPLVPYYLSLVAAALLDGLLYRLAPDAVVCYVCRAQHRGFPQKPPHPRFDRTIEERLRYGERAVMGSPMRDGGTAGAPDPEH